MLVEIFLKFLICIVYVELLEVINLRGETIQQVSLLLYIKLSLLTYKDEEKQQQQNLQRKISMSVNKRFKATQEGGRKEFTRPTRQKSYLEIFKSKDVKNANRLKVIFAFDSAVDLLDDPLEAACIKCHGQGVSAVYCLRGKDTCSLFPVDPKQPRQVSPSLSCSGDTNAKQA